MLKEVFVINSKYFPDFANKRSETKSITNIYANKKMRTVLVTLITFAFSGSHIFAQNVG